MRDPEGQAVIIPDSGGIAEQLQKRLEGEGISVVVKDDVGEAASIVIVLSGADWFDSADEAMSVNKSAFRAATAAASSRLKNGGCFVTVQRTGGDFGLRGEGGHNTWSAGLSGLVKTAAMEWPAAGVKAIDLAPSVDSVQKCADAIADELLYGGPEQEVGLYGDGTRTTLRAVTGSAASADDVNAAAAVQLPDKAVVVATGGARGVTAASVLAMAKRQSYRFVLMGRKELEPEPAVCSRLETPAQVRQALIQESLNKGEKKTPAEINGLVHRIMASREIRQTVTSLQKLGSEAVYLSVDVQDEAAVRRQLSEIRNKWGEVSVFIHGAGVLKDKLLGEKSETQFDAVFDTKVKGLRTLLQVLAEDELKSIFLFSSVVARTGNVGQSDYAMANEVLNKAAASERLRRNGECLVKSLNWGPWDGGMVSEAIKKIFEQRGMPLIPVNEGADQFAREFSIPAAGSSEILLAAGRDEGPAWGDLHPAEWQMEILLHEQQQPFLLDHKVNGIVVLPVVVALAWFVSFANACLPDLHFQSLQDLKMLKGVLLHSFSNEGHRLLIRGKLRQAEGELWRLDLHLTGEDGTVHYTGTAIFSSIPNESASMPCIPPVPRAVSSTREKMEAFHCSVTEDDTIQLIEWPWTVSDAYDGVRLFHGPSFQVIEQPYAMSSKSIAAKLSRTATARIQDVNGGTPLLAADLLDGGLQLMRLWGIQYLKMLCLPVKVDRVRIYQGWKDVDEVTCIAACRAIGHFGMIATVYFYDDAGRVLAELHDVEGYRTSEGLTS